MLAPMYWILAACFALIALAVPRLRPLGIVGCIVLAIMLAWAMTERFRDQASAPAQSRVQQRGTPASPAAQLSAIPLSQIDVSQLQLTGSGAPFELTGMVRNSSQLSLRSLTIHVKRLDCFAGALDPSGCVVLWQDRHWMQLSVPPGQERNFLSSIWMRGAAPRPRGSVRDDFELVGATGEAPRP